MQFHHGQTQCRKIKLTVGFSENCRGGMEVGDASPQVYRWRNVLRGLDVSAELYSRLGSQTTINCAVCFLC